MPSMRCIECGRFRSAEHFREVPEHHAQGAIPALAEDAADMELELSDVYLDEGDDLDEDVVFDEDALDEDALDEEEWEDAELESSTNGPISWAGVAAVAAVVLLVAVFSTIYIRAHAHPAPVAAAQQVPIVGNPAPAA